MDNLSKNLKYLRQLNSLSLKGISNELGVKRTTYYAWEQGVSAPPIKDLIKISNVYNVTIDQLVKSVIETNEASEEYNGLKYKAMYVNLKKQLKQLIL